MGRAEEGSAAFCSFYNSCWYWYLLGGEFDFLAALFLYIYVLIILGPNICLLHIYIIHLGAGFACISCFSHLVSEGVERHGEKGGMGGGEGFGERAGGGGPLVSGTVCACTTKYGLAEAEDCLINRISLATLCRGTDTGRFLPKNESNNTTFSALCHLSLTLFTTHTLTVFHYRMPPSLL